MSSEIDFSEAEKNNPELKAFYDNKKLFYRNVFWLAVGGAAAAIGVNTASTVMPLHMDKIGMDAEQISNVMAVRGYLTLPLALYLAQLSDRWQSKRGRRIPFLAASIPFTVLSMWFFPYTASMLSCLLVFSVFHFAMNVKNDTYPFISYDIARKKYWGRVNGLTMVIGGIGTWLGQVLLLPMMDVRGDKHVYLLFALIVGIATVLTVLFSKEPPIRSETPPEFNPIPVIKHIIKVGFSNKRNVQLFIANGFLCEVGLIGTYIPLQAKVNLKMTTGDIGVHILQYGTIAGIAFAFFVGWAIDRLGSRKTIFLGLLFGVLGALVGFKPTAPLTLSIFDLILKPISLVVGHTINASPVMLLAAAGVFIAISQTFMYWSQHIYTSSLVRREDLATFGTCNGAVFVLILTLVTQLCGLLIKRVFHGDYGYSFVIATAFTVIGVPLFLYVDYLRRKDNEKVLDNSIVETVK